MVQSAPFPDLGQIDMSLTSSQIRALRAESHRLKLKPVVIIGQHGVSENVLNELEQALTHHELIKVRIPALEKPERSVLIDGLCEQLNADLVQRIGHVIVLFRSNPKKARFDKLINAKS
jgi:RNA-binding protein